MAHSDSVYKTWDEFYDHLCSICDENNTKSEALFCCNICKTLMCVSCKQLHSQLYKNHNVLDKEKVDQWIVQNALSTDMCETHNNKSLDMFCEEHDEVCCYVCVSTIHRSCKQVKHIQDAAKGIHQKQEFLDMLTSVSQLQDRLIKFRQRKQFNRKQVQKESDDIVKAVKSFRQSINKTLDVLEKNTTQLVDSLMTELDKQLQHDEEAYHSMHETLKKIMDNIYKQGKSNESKAFCGLKKCKKKSKDAEEFLKTVQNETSNLTFTPNPNIELFLSSLDGLGEIASNRGSSVYKTDSFKMLNIKIPEDGKHCCITGVCFLPDGNAVIVDNKNSKIKLLDTKYSVIDQCSIPDHTPNDLCHIGQCKVAVTMRDYFGKNEIQFLNAVNGKLSSTRTVNLDHHCTGITFYGGLLYIGGSNGLFMYTVAGTLVKKLYTDDVFRVAVGDDGKRIYVTKMNEDSLVTLDDTYNVMSKLMDPDLKYTTCVAVTNTESVFLCGQESNTIVQIDRDGKRKLSTTATSSEGVDKPTSLCFNKKTIELIVGQDNDQMLVIKLKY